MNISKNLLAKNICNRLLVIITISIFINITLYSQSFKSKTFSPNFRITYEFNFCPDTTNKNDVISRKMYLFICDTVSVFVSSEKFIYDSILSNEQTFKGFDAGSPDFSQKTQALASSLPKVQDNSIIIKSRNANKIRVTDLVGLDYYYYDEEQNILNWRLENTTSQYDSLNCKTANLRFRGRNYYALYSLDIPLADGPYKFCLLPGLIVHIFDDLREVEYKLLAIENYTQNISLIGSENMVNISRQKMRELKVQYFLNPYILADSNLKNFKIDDNQKAAVIESRKKILEKRGNRIEKE